ncbi:MAG TPA: isocitrate/isopropylmalate family dehydrogenase [Tepidisphaeraceae bacterium]|nr:isocitrate/isopropylmalate family dehydrogenase [Tepidisphaeraceae bacterium]
MSSYRIALYPGDGIGPEVLEQAVRVIEACPRHGPLALEWTHFDWGADYCQGHGVVVPPDYLQQLGALDAIFLGALGDPRRLPDHTTLEPLIKMRQSFDQYACVRPAMLFDGVRSPLAEPGAIDMVVVRENSEGEYVSCGGRVKQGSQAEMAVQTAVHTCAGVERVMRFAFNLARKRRKHLTVITKSNALKFSMVMWDEILERLAPEFQDVKADRMHVDAAAMDFVRRPGRFDVVVASNLFGDILTDLSAALVGGLGLAPSANLNPERHFPSMFEPVHGSAPDIAGCGIANPAAAILSGAMMLDWLEMPEMARRIRTAVGRALSAGHTTPDLGGNLNTRTMTDHIIQHLEQP